MMFTKGQSGNPAGRPPGARNKATLAMETLLDGESEKLTRMVIEKAVTGDAAALRLCMDRIMPRRRDQPVPFTLPRIESLEDAVRASAEITEAIGCGYLTPREARELLGVVRDITETLQAGELADRVRRLEERGMHQDAANPAGNGHDGRA